MQLQLLTVMAQTEQGWLRWSAWQHLRITKTSQGNELGHC